MRCAYAYRSHLQIQSQIGCRRGAMGAFRHSPSRAMQADLIKSTQGGLLAGRRAAGRPQQALRRSTRCNVKSDSRPATRDADPGAGSPESLDNLTLPDRLPVSFGEGALEEAVAKEGDPAPEAVAPKGRSKISGSLKGMLLLNLGAALFGSNQVVIKDAEEMLSATGLNAWRFLLAALCFAPLLPRAFKERSMLKPATELSLWLTAGYTAQAFGLAMTTASNGAFTGTFTVLAVPFLVGLSGRKVARKTYFAAAAALFGVSLLTTGDGTPPNMGDALCVASAVLFGVHKFRSESITARVDDTVALVALQLAILASVSIALAVPEVLQYMGDVSWSTQSALSTVQGMPWDEIAFMGIGTTALTLWIEMDSLKEVSAPLAALIYSAEPLWGASLAWILLQERWGAQGWVGAALIVGSSLVCQLGGDPAERASLKSQQAATDAAAKES